MFPSRQRRQRRQLLAGGLSLSALLQGLSACSAPAPRRFARLLKDPLGLCDLPAGFGYRVISRHGERMSDGHTVPDYHDGMACFAAPAGGCVLVRNHEVPRYFPFDPPSPLPELAYDPQASGGTTTIWLDARLELQRHHWSLSGTIRNCGGGRTPWGSWISCEEAAQEAWQMGDTRHGYNFEVDPRQPPRRTLPLRAMGRFNHEAIAVDARSGIVYQTEDAIDGCFYRFLPRVPGQLAHGGRLQALKFVDPALRSGDALPPGRRHPCTWVDIAEPDPEDDSVRLQAQAQGAALFVRGEGMVAQPDGICFACTAGGSAGLGQLFCYRPGEAATSGGTLELIYSVGAEGPLRRPDNLTLAPWGDLLICEDSGREQHGLAALTPAGRLYWIAANAQAEWAGACFSPDGLTLFVNIHKKPGMTLAIRGDWQGLRTQA